MMSKLNNGSENLYKSKIYTAIRIQLSIFTVFVTVFALALTGTSPAKATPGDTMDLTFVTQTSGSQVVLPLTGSFTGISIIWGDGSTNTSLSHTYAAAGTYNVEISAPTSGTVTFGYIPGWTGAQYLTAVTYWSGLTSLEGAFSHATNLTSVPNYIPSTVTNAHYMFWHADSFNSPNVTSWDTSHLTNMSRMFADLPLFNQNIGGWNTSNVNTMASMFVRDVSFNQDLHLWDTGQVTDMSSMFEGASAFNGNVTTWDTGNVTTMRLAFAEAPSFNQDIGNWNTSKVTNTHAMFVRSPAFNQNLNSWDVSHVTDMQYMFQDDVNFNGQIGSWDTRNVTLMTAMFFGATNFNQDISAWNTSSVTDTMYMFMNATTFNQNLNSWNMAANTNVSRMFESAPAFNSPLGSWDLRSNTTMFRMFARATAFNQDIGSWDTSNVTDMALVFLGATSFNQDISDWNTSNAVSMRKMFQEAPNFNQDISGWNTSQVTDMSEMFELATSFNQPIGSWDTRNVTELSYMFYYATSFNADISGWTTSNVTDLAGTFQGASAFNQPIGRWDTSSVVDFTDVLAGATAFDQSIGGWNLSGAGSAAFSIDLTGLSASNFSDTLIGWANGWTVNGVTYHVPPGITTAFNHEYVSNPATQAAIATLTNTYGWNLSAETPVYLVTYQLAGAAGTTPSTLSLPIGSAFTTDAATGFSRLGYTFLGWSNGTTIYGSGTLYPSGSSSVVFTALWQPNSFHVRFDSQGGTRVDDQITHTDEAIFSPPAQPAKDGYIFVGWFLDKVTGSAISFPYSHHQIGDFTLYAQWAVTNFTVSFDSQGGTSVSDQLTKVGDVLGSAPVQPTKPGSRFIGWFTDAIGGAAISWPYAHKRTGSFTLFAHWEPVPDAGSLHTIRFDISGGQGVTPTAMALKTGSTVTVRIPTEFSREGYTFIGWLNGSKFYSIGSEIIVGETDATLVAQWKADDFAQKPGTPASPVAVFNGQVAVITVVSSITGGSPTEFLVSASNGTSCKVSVPESSCQISGLIPGETYWFTAIASNTAGSSLPSADSNHVWVPLPPVKISQVTLGVSAVSAELTKTGSSRLNKLVKSLHTYPYASKLLAVIVSTIVVKDPRKPLTASQRAAALKAAGTVEKVILKSGIKLSFKVQTQPVKRQTVLQERKVIVTLVDPGSVAHA